ncbi:MAG: hypothetical protein WC969_15080 [Elusimicrobiota bacterium]|jgi:hypothetical protein
MQFPRRLALVFAFAFAATVSVVTQTLAGTPPGTDSEVIRKITDAIATGNAAQLAEFSHSYREPVADTAHAPLNTTLARAWLFLGDTARALNFAKAAYTHSPDPVPRWLAAELLYARGNWPAADLLAVSLKNRDPSSPIVPYLEARYILARLADTDADFGQPMMGNAKHDLLTATVACTSAQARAHPDFDPRFLSLGIDAGLDLSYAFAADYAVQLTALRPLNAPLARLALALALDTPALRNDLIAALRTRNTLPAAELTLWELHASLIELAPENKKGAAWLALSKAAKNNPQFAPVYVHLIARAAALISPEDERFSSVRNDYMDAALQARSAPHARAAIALRWKDPSDTAEIRERLIDLATLASRHHLAATLAMKETPSHADDFEWLSSHRPIVARAQIFGVYIQYLKLMERIRPNEPIVLLEIARVYDQHDLSGAMDYYARAFAVAPKKIRPTLKDWFAYETLARAAAQSRQPANAEELFDATTERIHAAAPDDVAAAYFYADLLDRRAQLSEKHADRQAADAAKEHARALDPEAGDILERMRAKARSELLSRILGH